MLYYSKAFYTLQYLCGYAILHIPCVTLCTSFSLMYLITFMCLFCLSDSEYEAIYYSISLDVMFCFGCDVLSLMLLYFNIAV